MPESDAERALLARDKPRLFVHQDSAVNAEPAPALLDSALTPVETFFVRNNGIVPQPGDAADWTLTIDGAVADARRWTLAELKARFETVSVTAVLECAGNGRSQFVPKTDGLQWRLGAVGCARWTGFRLADLLDDVGALSSAVYTGHFSLDHAVGAPGKPALSRGLPIAKALSPETLVAFAMNDAPLSLLHGAPLRIVAPGYPGSAWQKWLSRIAVLEREHDGPKMTGTDYRMPKHPVDPDDSFDPADFAVITDMPVKSLITTPAEGFSVPAGERLTVAGFGWSGHVPLAGVEVSADGGQSWLEASLERAGDPFAWRRFAIEIAPPVGPIVLMARARDIAGNRQPHDNPGWNPRGYLNNRIHRVSGRAE